jgi:nicotinamidase-related amidase
MNDSALMIVDMQRYYLENDSAYSRYFSFLYPGSLEYIRERAENIVIPNIISLRELFYSLKLPVIYLKLSSEQPDRSDIIEPLKPKATDTVINKTTFSPFSSTDIDRRLKVMGIKSLIFTGLATSQCVETSARDASDRGYDVIHISDAQADYDEMTHSASLFSSRGVCGGVLYETDEYISYLKEYV